MVIAGPCPAAHDRNLVLQHLCRCLLCHTDKEPPARKRNTDYTRGGRGGGGTFGCHSRPPESPFPLQCSAHAGRSGEVPPCHGGGRDRTPGGHAAVHAERRWP